MALNRFPPLRRRTRRQLPVKTPPAGTPPQHIIHRAAMRENVLPSHPRLIPVLAIDLQALHIVLRIAVAACSCDIQALPATKIDIHTEPGRHDQEGGLSCQWVQADDVPQQPGLHGPGVAVPGEA